jgi:hypothetical protein
MVTVTRITVTMAIHDYVTIMPVILRFSLA